MIFENGFFIMNGSKRGDKLRVRTAEELVELIKEVGFLPLFSNEVKGFSVEEHVPAGSWWTGDVNTDPWEWRETISRGKQVAYGKFFGKKAGYISKEWLPYFANYRRDGYDFDARYLDGLANRRQKLIMDFYMGEDANGDIVWKKDEILSTDLKKLAGFGKGGEKNYPGIITDLQMMMYLVITDFRRRVNKRGEQYGMSVSVMFPPETVWGYDLVTSAYSETPGESYERIVSHLRELFPDADDDGVTALIGAPPRE